MDGFSDYGSKSARLLDAAQRFHSNLGDDGLSTRVTDDLLLATQDLAASELRFEAARGAAPTEATDQLASALLSLQAGNTLLGAGLIKQELGAGAFDTTLSVAAQRQIETARHEILTPGVARLRFDPDLRVRSSSVDEAMQAFRRYATELLSEIVHEVRSLLVLALDKLADNVAPFKELLTQLGERLPLLQDVGRLVRRGMELIKRAMDALGALFSKDTTEEAKRFAAEIWDHAKDLGDMLLGPLLGATKVERRIEEVLQTPALTLAQIDQATNRLSRIGAEFDRNKKLLRAIIQATAVAGPLLAYVPFIAPAVPSIVGGAYVAVIGAAFLVGNQYTGAKQWLGHATGVEQAAETILVR